MQKSSLTSRTVLLTLVGVLLLFPALASSYHGGIGGPQSHQGSTGQVDIDDVAKSGCLCHNEVADNAVQVILDDVPFAYVAGETYTLQLQLIGGPPATGTYTAGFSMRVSLGTLASDAGQNWEIDGAVDEQTLTHTEASAATEDRAWAFDWTAPETGSGTVNFWIVGNAVNGDQIPGVEDRWNQLNFALNEGGDASAAMGTRTLFAGDGNVAPPEPAHHGIDLHHMGAKLRAHWLGLLGFGAVIGVVIFAGLLLRYGFSTSYKGRSNQLRLRYKLMRRGDQ
ncbi:MAG: choice-of-anchor V domain-containing protein [Candidatus Thermoplasmatota archaeon]|nr:choice-of-anchor V domain-containing protein [Candidatus Thermoplasmatota archaeon]